MTSGSRNRRRLTRAVLVGAIGAVTVLVPITAAAAPYPSGGNPPTEVLPETEQRNPQQPTTVQPSAAVAGAAAQRSTLPFTGGDLAGIAALGLAAAGTGTVLVRRSRRRV